MRMKLSELKKIIKEEVEKAVQAGRPAMTEANKERAILDFLENVKSRSRGRTGDLIFMVVRLLGGELGLAGQPYSKWTEDEFSDMMKEYFGPRNIGLIPKERPDKYMLGKDVLETLKNDPELKAEALRYLGSNR